LNGAANELGVASRHVYENDIDWQRLALVFDILSGDDSPSLKNGDAHDK
jgi:hypothetical protein